MPPPAAADMVTLGEACSRTTNSLSRRARRAAVDMGCRAVRRASRALKLASRLRCPEVSRVGGKLRMLPCALRVCVEMDRAEGGWEGGMEGERDVGVNGCDGQVQPDTYGARARAHTHVHTYSSTHTHTCTHTHTHTRRCSYE